MHFVYQTTATTLRGLSYVHTLHLAHPVAEKNVISSSPSLISYNSIFSTSVHHLRVHHRRVHQLTITELIVDDDVGVIKHQHHEHSTASQSPCPSGSERWTRWRLIVFQQTEASDPNTEAADDTVRCTLRPQQRTQRTP